jgi:hypothetical protein
MKPITLVALILFFMPAIAAAQEHTAPESNPARTKPQSQRYLSEAGRYSVLFPDEPKLSTQNISTPTGEPMVQYMAMSFGGGTVYMVGYFDYPAGITFNLDKARDGMIESAKGTLIDQQSISLGGAPGKQVKFAGRTDDGIDFINRTRLYDITPRVFVIQCMVVRTDDSPAAAEKCENFFDSFKVRSAP